MKNKKGFTLTEILVTLLILGVILAIAVPTFGKVLEKFKTDYYENQEQTLLVAGKEYFNDNKTQMPSDYLFSKVIELSALNGKYLDKDLTKYRSKNSCSEESYVVIIKDIDKYIYQACLKCGDYETDTSDKINTEEDYCNKAWKNSENIKYNWGQNGNVYLYAGNYTQKELRNKLGISTKTIEKHSENNKGLKKITIDTGETYYPSGNITLNTNIEQNSKIEYSVPKATKNTSVLEGKDINIIIYKHSAPTVNGISESVINLSNDNNTIKLSVSDDTFTYKSTTDTYLSKFISYQVSENNGDWKNIDDCSEIESCNYNPKDGVKTVKFRVLGKNNVDNKIEIGKETTSYTIQKIYTLTYNNNGGSGCSSKTGTYGNAWGTLCTPIKSGYKFNGWYTPSNIQVTSTTIVTGSLSVTAKWTPNTYTVKYNANGGSGQMSDIICTIGSVCNLSQNTFSKLGNSFVGWSTSSNGNVQYGNQASVTNFTSIPNSTVNLYAIWASNGYILTYSNGGSGCISKRGTYGNAWGTLCTPTKTGNTFNGWYTSNNIEVTSATIVTGNLTVYPKWTPNTYTLTYNNNGGSGCTSKTGIYGNTWGTLCTPTKTGNTFNGWETSNGTQVTSGTEVTDDVTVTAKWASTDTSGPTCTWDGPSQDTLFTTIKTNVINGQVVYYRLICNDNSGISDYGIVVGASGEASYIEYSDSSTATQLNKVYKVTAGKNNGSWALGVENVKDNLNNTNYTVTRYSDQISINNTPPECPGVTINKSKINGTNWYEDKIILNVTPTSDTTKWEWYTNTNSTSYNLSYNGNNYINWGQTSEASLSYTKGLSRRALIKVYNSSNLSRTCEYGPYYIDKAPEIYANISSSEYNSLGSYINRLDFNTGEWYSALNSLKTDGHWTNNAQGLWVASWWKSTAANAITIEEKTCYNTECSFKYLGCAKNSETSTWYTNGVKGSWSDIRINDYYNRNGYVGTKNYYKYKIKVVSSSGLSSINEIFTSEYYSNNDDPHGDCDYE